jgi:hypothetical protein
MKKLLGLILILLITLNCNAQYSNNSEPKINQDLMVIPVCIVFTTAMTVDIMRKDTDKYDQIDVRTAALLGVAVSTMSYIVIKKAKKNPPRKVYKKRIKKLSRL